MSYIDNSKNNMMREIYILEQENEMLRNQIRKLKIELNELLDNAKPKGEYADYKRNVEIRRDNN
ncbi:MAG: hypothetical protein ACR2IM_05935 [Sediminibacterium sp.]